MAETTDRKAVSEADFDQVELDIDYDIFEEEPWTLDPVRVTIIKNLLERKKMSSNSPKLAMEKKSSISRVEETQLPESLFKNINYLNAITEGRPGDRHPLPDTESRKH